jgi:cellulose synthase/poly-beta-1,6-N-acetylglucosamine synthase-like glycosyltransferase
VSSAFDSLVVTVFMLSTCMLAAYSLHLYVLVWLFHRRHPAKAADQRSWVEHYRATTPPEDWPAVTTQLPIYNEADVAVRVIHAAAAMEYPAGKHCIQVLDDSTDETRLLIDRAVRRLREQGVDIEVIRREGRKGYKAGALQAAMSRVRTPLIAIFDADFVPPRDFLLRATPLLARDEKLACLQGRWEHLNAEESWMTRAQSLGLDGHFAVEQGARAWNGLLMNFNGTAGVWRKAAIEDPAVGGWSDDTLTEDLDLSYRVQLAGWKIDFCLELACPAELPNTIAALKAQQRRWATGGVQTAVKLLPRIWRARLGLHQKLEATIHLTHYFVALWMVFLCILVRPILVMIDPVPYFWAFVTSWSMMLLATLAPTATYTYARWVLGRGWSGRRDVPGMMVLGTGLAINNGLAVLRGIMTRGGEFVRTPKSGTTGTSGMASRYKAQRGQLMWFWEMLLGAYCLANWAICVTSGRWFLSLFLAIYAFGFLRIGWMSRPEASGRRRVLIVEDDEPVATPLEPAVKAVSA